MKRILTSLLLFILVVNNCSAQSKAYVLQNSWTNTLNPFNASPFFEQLFPMLQKKLKVKEIDRNPLSTKINVTEDEFKEMISKHAKDNTASNYYIVLNSDLSIPLINLTRVIFKMPTRSSRFVFTINVYNNKAEKILSDTIVNRGCVTKVINQDKMKEFYDDYAKFRQDLQCHFEAVRKELEIK